MTTILVGTQKGLHAFDTDGGRGPVRHADRAVTALGAEYPEAWAILDGVDVWRTDGGDASPGGTLNGAGVRANCIASTGAGRLIGTSEAHLYRVGQAGIEPVEAFERVDARDRWFTPWGGPPDVRSISEDADVVLVNVHVGGIVRTLDGGATWEPTIDIEADVHRVWALDGRVYAACARGLAVSEDRGDSWAYRTEGLHAQYCRAVAVCGETVLVTASNGPRGGRGAIYRGGRSGGPLERCTTGLPDWFDDNIDSLCVDALPETGAAAFGTADGRVFASTDEGSSWTEVVSGMPGIRCVLLMP